jgi:hypothetical protein
MRSSTLVALPVAGLLLAALDGRCAGADIRVQGPADDVRVEAHGATTAEILAALGERYAVRYRGTPIGSDLTVTFQGPLRRVLVRVLAGNNYVVKRGADGFEVIVLNGASSGAIAPTIPAVVVHRRDPFAPK